MHAYLSLFGSLWWQYSVWCVLQMHAAAFACRHGQNYWKKNSDIKRKRTERTRSAHPEKNATEKQRLVYILLTQSHWTPTLLPGTVLNSYFEAFAVGPGDKRCTKQSKIYNTPWLSSSVHSTHANRGSRSTGCCLVSKWVSVSGTCLHRDRDRKKKVYLFLSSHIPGWHFPDIRSLQKIAAHNSREWFLQSAAIGR